MDVSEKAEIMLGIKNKNKIRYILARKQQYL